MDTIKQLEWRYATKKFNPEKTISKSKLDIVKQAFNLTATSYGLQTVKLVVVEDKLLRAALVKVSYNQKQVLEASHLLVICIQREVTHKDVNAYYDDVKEQRQTPDAVLKPYKEGLINTLKSMSFAERQAWCTNQAYIALGNLMTVCALEGIDACPMEGFIPVEYDTILNLEAQGLKSVLLLPIGYRANDDTFSQFKKVRKPLQEVVIEI